MDRSNSISALEYSRLVESLFDQAAAYAMSILRRRADAEDAVQQAALNGLERLSTYEPERPFKGWWFVVLRNCCYDILRERPKNLPDAGIERTAAVQTESPKSAEVLASALERLSPEHSEILRLRYYGGLSYREIAQSLGIPDGTVMSRLHLARKALAAIVNVEDL